MKTPAFPARAALFLLLLGAAPALAEIENPNLLPMGEEEAFLGNAGIAHTESTGATYYNPGALGFIRSKKISVYANAYLGSHIYIRQENRLVGNDVPLEASSFTPVPLSSVTIFGNDRLTYAFSVHVPYSSTYAFQMPFQADNAKLALVGQAAESSLWIGPSVGRKVTDDFGWGASLYAVRYALNSMVLADVTASSGSNSVTGTAGNSQESKDWSALAVLGAQWRLSADWRVGARVQTQSLDLHGKSSYYSIGSGSLNGQAFNNLTNESGYDSRYRLPFQLGLGLETTAVPRLELLADANAQFPIDYQTAPSRPLYSSRVLTKFQVRGNVGAKWHLGINRSLLLGFLYNPSTMANASSTVGSFSAENFKGVTAGLQYDTGVLVTGLGGFVLWANGNFQEENTNGTVMSPVEHQMYGALVTASYKL